MKRIRVALCLLLFLTGALLMGWNQEIRFADVTSVAGLREPLDGMMAHAAAWGDIDGDGDLDLYMGGFSDRPDADYRPASRPVRNRIFRNLSDGRFEEVVSPAVELFGRTTAAVFVDLDNNGTADLFVTNNARTSSRLEPGIQRGAQLRSSALFRNDQGAFVDVSAGAGACLTAPGAARGIGVLDYDLDGAVDLLVLEDRFGSRPRSRLCRNLGDFRFTDVTTAVGLPPDLFGLGLAIADLNDDGRPDIFVSHSNRLFLSTQAGKYIEPSGPKAALAWTPLDAEDWPAGAVFADLNRDARFDLVMGIHHERARNRVYLNDGLAHNAPIFRDVSVDVGLPAHLSVKSPHVEAQDFDNDGWPDLYFSSAWVNGDGSVTPLVFRNAGLQGGLPRFEPMRQISSDQPEVYFPAGPSGDYDGDGRLDLLLANWFQGNYSRLLRNVSDGNRWLDVSVRGGTVNQMGIGAKVRVYKAGNRGGGLLGFREIGIGHGFAGGQAPIAHFGLGAEANVDVEVVFSESSRIRLPGIQANQRLAVEQP